MSILNQKDIRAGTTEDTVQITQGVRRNKEDTAWEMIHQDRDAWMLEIVNSSQSEEGYISIKRAPATSGTPVFSELVRIDHNGNLILRVGQLQEL